MARTQSSNLLHISKEPKTGNRGIANFLKHLSGEEMIQILEKKRAKKDRRRKQRKKESRERLRKSKRNTAKTKLLK